MFSARSEVAARPAPLAETVQQVAKRFDLIDLTTSEVMDVGLPIDREAVAAAQPGDTIFPTPGVHRLSSALPERVASTSEPMSLLPVRADRPCCALARAVRSRTHGATL